MEFLENLLNFFKTNYYGICFFAGIALILLSGTNDLIFAFRKRKYKDNPKDKNKIRRFVVVGKFRVAYYILGVVLLIVGIVLADKNSNKLRIPQSTKSIEMVSSNPEIRLFEGDEETNRCGADEYAIFELYTIESSSENISETLRNSKRIIINKDAYPGAVKRISGILKENKNTYIIKYCIHKDFLSLEGSNTFQVYFVEQEDNKLNQLWLGSFDIDVRTKLEETNSIPNINPFE